MNNQQKTDLFRNAKACLDAGINLVPLKADGTKRPAVASWKHYQSNMATADELASWVDQGFGFAFVTGVISGGLECLDFDERPDETFAKFRDLVDHILIRLPVVETPSGGRHVFYRCDEITGSVKLALPIKGRPLVETRGDKAYVCSILNDERIHSTGELWIQSEGVVLPEIPRITPDERRELWAAAISLDEQAEVDHEAMELLEREKRRQKQIVRHSDEVTPWDAINSIGFEQWGTLLRMANWTSKDGTSWQHPGATSACSANLRKTQSGGICLSLFSSSIPRLRQFESHSAYKFLKEVVLEGATDSEAVKAIKELRF